MAKDMTSTRRNICRLIAQSQQRTVQEMSPLEYDRVLAENVMPAWKRAEYAARFPFLVTS